MMVKSKNVILSGAQVYTEHGVIKNSAVVISKNKIASILQQKNFADAEHVIFPENYHLIPGMIDLHIHGAAGRDVMDGDGAALAAIRSELAQEGVTGFLATTMTASAEKIKQVLENIRAAADSKISGAAILGVHLEGPFLSPKKVGAQRAAEILAPDIALFKTWQAAAGGLIKVVTLAPELQNSLEFIRYLCSQQIVAAIGHTDATYAEAVSAIAAGCTHVTHLFNAMRPLHHREPGVAAAALLSEQVSAEIIADGVHLHPAMVELILKTKKNIVLVTDAMRAKCMPEGDYELGGQHVAVRAGVARLGDGTLAGSTLKMSTALRNVLKFTRYELMDVIKLAAENPARALNLFACKGSIAEGKDADLVVLNDQLEVVMTMVSGEVVYQNGFAG